MVMMFLQTLRVTLWRARGPDRVR
ncbi:hypothetical protein SGPA1_60053 [Streptomyces misionensis JCM 4497]